MGEKEQQIRQVILWAAQQWHISLYDVLAMPLQEFEQWCEVSYQMLEGEYDGGEDDGE